MLLFSEKLVQGITVKQGKYIIGEDIPAGTYIITCTETEDYFDETMNMLEGLVGLLDEETGNAYKMYFNLLGSLAGE